MKKNTFYNLKDGEKFALPDQEEDCREIWMKVRIATNDNSSSCRGGILSVQTGICYDISVTEKQKRVLEKEKKEFEVVDMDVHLWHRYIKIHGIHFSVLVVE